MLAYYACRGTDNIAVDFRWFLEAIAGGYALGPSFRGLTEAIAGSAESTMIEVDPERQVSE